MLACRVQQMVREVPCKSTDPLTEELVLGNECQIVSRCAFRSYFETFSEKMLAIVCILTWHARFTAWPKPECIFFSLALLFRV